MRDAEVNAALLHCRCCGLRFGSGFNHGALRTPFRRRGMEVVLL